jgi:hypothetical protein
MARLDSTISRDTTHSESVSKITGASYITATKNAKDYTIKADTGASKLSTQTMDALKLNITDSSTTPSAGKYITPTMQANATRHLRFTIIDPKAAYGKDSCIAVWNKLDVAIVITNLEVSCGADPTTEPTGDLKYADALIGRANPIVINAFDTASGVLSDASITTGAVPAGKCIFVKFDAEPETAMTQISFDISYHL